MIEHRKGALYDDPRFPKSDPEEANFITRLIDNFKLPKGSDAKTISLPEVLATIAEQEANPTARKKAAARKPAVAKKAAPKKAASKKAPAKKAVAKKSSKK